MLFFKPSKKEKIKTNEPTRGDSDDVNVLLGQAKRRLADREAQANEFAKSGSPVRMANKSGHKALVQPDMSRGRGWRVTMLDDSGPMGHREFDNAYDAFHAALSDGYTPHTSKDSSVKKALMLTFSTLHGRAGRGTPR